MKTFSLRINDPLYDSLRAMAAKEGNSLVSKVRQLLAEAVARESRQAADQ
jgi:hypothetical protein